MTKFWKNKSWITFLIKNHLPKALQRTFRLPVQYWCSTGPPRASCPRQGQGSFWHHVPVPYSNRQCCWSGRIFFGSRSVFGSYFSVGFESVSRSVSGSTSLFRIFKFLNWVFLLRNSHILSIFQISYFKFISDLELSGSGRIFSRSIFWYGLLKVSDSDAQHW